MFTSHLSQPEAAGAVQWLRENYSKIQWNLGYPRTAPSLPAIILVIGSESEADEPIGSIGHGTGGILGGTEWDGVYFSTTYRVLCLAANGNDLTYLSHAIKFSLLRYRYNLNLDGLFDIRLTMTDLLPADGYSDPNLEVFQRGVMLTGTHFAEYPTVMTQTITSVVEQDTFITPKESKNTDNSEVDITTVTI